MTDGQTPKPAGWYPQPDGQQRYWDGQEWTQHVAPMSGQPAVAPTIATTGAPAGSGAVPDARKWYAKKRVIIPVAVIAVFTVIGIASGGNDPATTPTASDLGSSTTTSPAPAASTPTPVKATTAAPAPATTSATSATSAISAVPVEAPARQSGLGRAVRDGKFQFTVKGVKCGIAQVGDQYLGKKAQGQFCAVTMVVENIGDESQSIFADNQTAFDSGGRKYSADSTAAIYAEDSKLLFEDINPGNSLTGAVYFDVPKGVTLTKLELHDSFMSSGVTVDLR